MPERHDTSSGWSRLPVRARTIERVIRVCPVCHQYWPADWEMCPNCAVYLGGTERIEHITYVVPRNAGGPGGAANEGAGTGAILACRLRCETPSPSEDDLQAGRDIFQRTHDAIEDHDGRYRASPDIGVIGCWSAEDLGLALRAASAIIGAATPARASGARRDVRLITGIGIALATDVDAPEAAARFAYRLADLAMPGTVLVSHDVYGRTVERFDYRGVGPAVPHADPLPGPVFRLLGPKPERSGTHHTGPERAPLLGRQDALQKLRACLDEAAGGEIVLHLIAEPGAGKSRLLREWLTADPARRQPHLMTHGVPYGGSPRAAWTHLVQPLSGDRDGATTTGPGRRILTAGEAAVRLRCLAPPPIVVVDDLHWIDPASREELSRLIALLPDTPSLVVLAYRPSFIGHAPKPRSRHRYLRLSAIDEAAMEALAAHVAARYGGVIPPTVRREIARLARGNPLYVEEAIAYVAGAQAAALDQIVALPPSLPELLIHRIRWIADRTLPELEDEQRRLRIFGYAPPQERAAVLERLETVEETIASLLDRFDVIAEDRDLLDEFLARLRQVDGQLALLSLLLGRQRPHRQRLAQGLTRLGARRDA
jgi:hypothetical protein